LDEVVEADRDRSVRGAVFIGGLAGRAIDEELADRTKVELDLLVEARASGEGGLNFGGDVVEIHVLAPWEKKLSLSRALRAGVQPWPGVKCPSRRFGRAARLSQAGGPM